MRVNNDNNNVHLSCTHQHPDRSHDTYSPKYNFLYTRRAQSYQNNLHNVLCGNTHARTHARTHPPPPHTHTHTHTHTHCSRYWVLILVWVEILWGTYLVQFMYLVFRCMPGENYRRRIRSILLYLCDVIRALINSLVSWLCTSALSLVLVQPYR